MHKVTTIPIVELNSLLICKLCNGYLIDSTTIVECLHSFCRTCIVNYLDKHNTCPICDTLLHKTRPHYAIKPDRALQAVVYKLVPNLFDQEMRRRRTYYATCKVARDRSLSPERRGEITLNSYVLQEEDRLSVALEYWQPQSCDGAIATTTNASIDCRSTTESAYTTTYLLCPPGLTIGHLEKLIRMKFGLKPGLHDVTVFYSIDDRFTCDYTLSDLACLYAWRRQQPLRLYFSITESPKSVAAASDVDSCGITADNSPGRMDVTSNSTPVGLNRISSENQSSGPGCLPPAEATKCTLPGASTSHFLKDTHSSVAWHLTPSGRQPPFPSQTKTFQSSPALNATGSICPQRA